MTAGWDLLGVAEGVEPSAAQVGVETTGGVVLMTAHLDVLGRIRLRRRARKV
ncbi:MAG: hypothetical protein IPJ15_15210 [Actinomycetales bacterium]|nr:hypothetical protein [Candidatus Phosphoribacter baldrii]